MKIIAVLLVVIGLSSCGKKSYLTVEETVRQCRVCESSGLFSEVHYSWDNHRTVSVTCANYRYKSEIPDYAKIKPAAQDTLESTAHLTTQQGTQKTKLTKD